MVDPTEAWITALGHPTRRDALRLIAESPEPVSPMQISKQLSAPLSNVSYHVRKLADCQAIKMSKTRPRRGSVEHFYEEDPGVWSTPWIVESLGLTKPETESGGAWEPGGGSDDASPA